VKGLHDLRARDVLRRGHAAAAWNQNQAG
jgi:hypothetical protein